MSKEIINIGYYADDNTGDLLTTCYRKCNSNFTELYDAFLTIKERNLVYGTPDGISGNLAFGSLLSSDVPSTLDLFYMQGIGGGFSEDRSKVFSNCLFSDGLSLDYYITLSPDNIEQYNDIKYYDVSGNYVNEFNRAFPKKMTLVKSLDGITKNVQLSDYTTFNWLMYVNNDMRFVDYTDSFTLYEATGACGIFSGSSRLMNLSPQDGVLLYHTDNEVMPLLINTESKTYSYTVTSARSYIELPLPNFDSNSPEPIYQLVMSGITASLTATLVLTFIDVYGQRYNTAGDYENIGHLSTQVATTFYAAFTSGIYSCLCGPTAGSSAVINITPQGEVYGDSEHKSNIDPATHRIRHTGSCFPIFSGGQAPVAIRLTPDTGTLNGGTFTIRRID